MRFVDFALQGFLDLRGAGQVRFGSALTAVSTSPASPDTLLTGLLEVIFAEGYDPASVRLAAPGAKSTRAVITFQASDESVFRLVRDIVRGSAQALQYDSEQRDFVLVATDAMEIAQFLRGRVGVPSRDILMSAFVITPKDLPSHQIKAIPPPTAAATVSGPKELTPQERAHLSQRLEQLKHAVAAHERVQMLEYELDGLQKRRFDLEDQLARRDMDSTAVDEARGRYESLRYLEQLPDDFALKTEHYYDAIMRRDQELARWRQEREELERISRAITVEPVLGDWRLWAGLAAGAAALAGGFLLKGPLRLVALADIPAFGLSAFVLWQHLGSLELRDNNRRKIKLSDRRRETIETRDEEEIRAVLNAVEQVGHQEPDEVVARWEGLNVAKAELESAERALQQVRADPELKRMKEEYALVRKQVGQLETELASSSLGGEATRVREEIDEIEAQLSGTFTPEPVMAVSAEQTVDVVSGPLKSLLRSASELMLVSPDEVATRLGSASSPIVSHLSGNQLLGVQLTPTGELSVLTGSGKPRPLLGLPPETQDVAYLSVRAGLTSLLDSRMRAPFVICDLSNAVPGGAPFVIAYASLIAQSNQTICIERELAGGWPEGTSVVPLVAA